MRLGDHLADVPCVALGRPTCGRAVPCYCVADVPCICVADVRWAAQLADVPCVADMPCVALGRPTCGRALRCGRALGHPTCGRADVACTVDMPCVCVADVRWGSQLPDMPCIALGCPTCGHALRCVEATNLGDAVLKGLPPSQNLFLSILHLVF